MKTALFTNFTNEEFIGYWGGKPKKFNPGQSLYMPDYLARHFAKHLTNRELLKKGMERDTSPKVKTLADGTEVIENVNFMNLFNKAYTPDESDEYGDEQKQDVDTLIDVANKNREKKSNSPQDPNEPQMVPNPDFDEEDGDEESFENKPVETN